MSTDAALGAALARIARVRTARLTTRGRRTGLPRHVTIWFAVDGDEIVLGTLDARRHWVRNARRNARVELEIAGVRLRGQLHEVDDPTACTRIREQIASKYWAAWIASWFGVRQRSTFRIADLELARS